jgi:hypothetical protein
MQFPKHEASMTLTHNDHRNVYQPLREWIVASDWCDWENAEAIERAIQTDECWTLQWYPNTPVGFNAVAAPTLEECLAFALKVESCV